MLQVKYNELCNGGPAVVDSKFIFRYFAMFLLNGDIFPKISEYKKQMRSVPKNIVRSWSKNTPHVLAFVNKLINRRVNNKQKLLDLWRKESNCKFACLNINVTVLFSLISNFQICCTNFVTSWSTLVQQTLPLIGHPLVDCNFNFLY